MGGGVSCDLIGSRPRGDREVARPELRLITSGVAHHNSLNPSGGVAVEANQQPIRARWGGWVDCQRQPLLDLLTREPGVRVVPSPTSGRVLLAPDFAIWPDQLGKGRIFLRWLTERLPGQGHGYLLTGLRLFWQARNSSEGEWWRIGVGLWRGVINRH